MAAVARAVSEAAAAAGRQAARCCRRRCARSRASTDVGAPVVVCNESHRFLVAEQLRAARHRAAGDRARAGRPQHRAGRRARGDGGRRRDRAAGNARSGAARPAGRSRDPRRAGIPGRGGRRPQGGGAGQARHLRRRAEQPETGYGYIRRGDGAGAGVSASRSSSRSRTSRRRRATSSPASISGTAACSCSARGRYLEELRALAPAIYAAPARRRSTARRRDLDFTRLPRRSSSACPSDSFDYAVMEKTAARAWSCRSMRAGATSAPGPRCTKRSPRDARRQRRARRRADRGFAGLLPAFRRAGWSRPSASTITSSSRPRTPCWSRRRDRVQDVKELVAQLKEQGRYETSLHREVFRPWGSYDSIDNGERFQVKRLIGEAGRAAVAAAASPSRRALDRGVGHGAHHARRGDVPARGEPVDLHSARRRSTASRIPARSRCTSSRCSPARTSARTTSCASRTATAAKAQTSEQAGQAWQPSRGFKAYDFRGRIPDELNPDVAYRIGRAYAEFLKPKRVVVGRDIRLSSAELCARADARPASIPASTSTTSACAARRSCTSRPSTKAWTAASW